jgi:pilus assembly protein CpaF
MSIAEQEELLDDICNDVLGYGPLEPLLAAMTSPTSWSMVPTRPISRSTARCRKPNIRFRDNAQLMNICQRIVSQVGRRVDESSPRSATRVFPTARVST